MSQPDIRDLLRSLLGDQGQTRFGDHASATTTRNGKIVGFSESQGRGRAASGDVEGSSHVSIKISGVPPRGEEGAIQACQRLVDHLNLIGQSWANPSEVSGVQHIDAIAVGEGSFSGKTLVIQVVRALTDPAFWQSLGHTGNSDLSLSLVEAADTLRAAVELKAQKIPHAMRSRLTLALDACDVPGFALDPVVEEFKLRHGQWASTLGFNSVWITGPWGQMVNQLSGANA